MSNTPTRTSFANFYTQEQLNAVLALSINEDKLIQDSPEDRAHWDCFFTHMEILCSAVGSLLRVKRDAGELQPVDFAHGRCHRWANAWNRFVECDSDTESDDLLVITRSFKQAMMILTLPQAGKTEVQIYKKLTDIMDEGCFDVHSMSAGFDCRGHCNLTGAILNIDMQAGWTPRLGVITAYPTGVTFTALTQDAPVSGVLMHSIPAPSGEMLVADWFVFENDLFTNLVRAGEPALSVNTEAGRAAHTQYYAREHGFMSVAVGDCSPQVLARKDHAVIGNFYDDEFDERDKTTSPLKGEIKGQICTDLHWASMIDKQVLLDLLSTVVPREQAEQEVATLCQSSDVVTLQMPPGKVYFHFTAKSGDMAHFKCDGPVRINRDGINAFLIALSSEPLSWRAKPAPRANKAPRP